MMLSISCGLQQIATAVKSDELRPVQSDQPKVPPRPDPSRTGPQNVYQPDAPRLTALLTLDMGQFLFGSSLGHRPRQLGRPSQFSFLGHKKNCSISDTLDC